MASSRSFSLRIQDKRGNMIKAFKMRLEYGIAPTMKMTRENRPDAVPLRLVFHLD